MTNNRHPDTTIQGANTGLVLVDSDNPFKLRPYQQEAIEALNARDRLEKMLLFPYRYGTGHFAKSGGGQSTPRFAQSLAARPSPRRQINGAPSKAALLAARAASVVNVNHGPVRDIAGLWEARKTPIYYHVQLALSQWFD